jgi:hypothetical protein
MAPILKKLAMFLYPKNYSRNDQDTSANVTMRGILSQIEVLKTTK